MFILKPITSDQLDSLKSALAQHDTTISPQGAGTYIITGHGIVANAIFDLVDESLTVTVIKKPFYVSEGAIQSGIEGALKG